MAREDLAQRQNKHHNYHWFNTQHHRVSNILSFAKKGFYKASLNEKQYNYQKLFGICKTLLGRSQDLPLPTCNSNKELANDFNEFFTNKIQKIRNTSETPPEMSDLPDDIALRQFRQVSIEETTRYVMKAPSKSCELDPIPTDLLKEVIHEV